jgi:hypothetical protein
MRFPIALLLTVTSASAAITAGTGASNTNHANSTVTATVTITAGNAVVAVASFQGTGSGCGAATITVASNGTGNTNFTADSTLHSRDFVCTGYFYLLDAASATTVTATSNAARDQFSISVFQFSGVDTSSALDVSTSSNRAQRTSSPSASNTFSTSTANQVIVCMSGDYYSGTHSAGDIGGTTGTLGSGGSFTGLVYRIVSATQSSITGAVAKTSTVYSNVGCLSLKEGAGGGGGNVFRRRMIVQ